MPEYARSLAERRKSPRHMVAVPALLFEELDLAEHGVWSIRLEFLSCLRMPYGSLPSFSLSLSISPSLAFLFRNLSSCENF